MNFWSLICILSSISSIVGLFISEKFKSNRWAYVTFTFITVMACGYAVNYNSELERIKNIHKQASSILEHYDSEFSEVFIQEVLTFLEDNKDRYPLAHERANKIYADMKDSELQFSNGPALELKGIMSGISTLNEDK